MANKLLENKIAVVTGGATGIGKEIVRELAENDATVILADRNAPLGEKEAQEFQALQLKEGLQPKQEKQEQILLNLKVELILLTFL